MSKYRRHYEDYLDDNEYEWTGYGTDDGYDACKDANAEMGLSHDDPRGFYAARSYGWLRKVKRRPPINDD